MADNGNPYVLQCSSLFCPGFAVGKNMSHIHAVMSPSLAQSWRYLDLALQD